MTDFTFCEFFAGGGMARAGLGANWRCLFSNDIDAKKVKAYNKAWNASLIPVDILKVSSEEVPDQSDLFWASFPCQDLSLAGNGLGLKGERSGTFWSFFEILRKKAGGFNQQPRVIVLENVLGAVTSHNGLDFKTITEALVSIGYRVGAIIIDAVHFVPQSRPRLFIVGVIEGVPIPEQLRAASPSSAVGSFFSPSLKLAGKKIENLLEDSWIWWNLPTPTPRSIELKDIIDTRLKANSWDSKSKTQSLIDMMSSTNLEKLDTAKEKKKLVIGTLYKRTRYGKQCAEVRFDGVAGCIRTPAGGSSRQTVIVVHGESVRTRLLSVREAASLMGLSFDYPLPENYNEGYHLVGDGLVVPVVRYLADALIEPLVLAARSGYKAVA